MRQLDLERCLNRGREIYESIHPAANRVRMEFEELSAEERAQRKIEDEEDAAPRDGRVEIDVDGVKYKLSEDDARARMLMPRKSRRLFDAMQRGIAVKANKAQIMDLTTQQLIVSNNHHNAINQ